MKQDFKEIEVRFLEINPEEIKSKLKSLGAKDLGEENLTEIIFSDKEKTWFDQNIRVRLRKSKNKIHLAYKHTYANTALGTREIEFLVPNWDKAREFLIAVGLIEARIQEKRRHTFKINNGEVVIDYWPNILPWIEIEAESEEDIKEIAKALELDWKNVRFEDAAYIIENDYSIPVKSLKVYTFDKME